MEELEDNIFDDVEMDESGLLEPADDTSDSLFNDQTLPGLGGEVDVPPVQSIEDLDDIDQPQNTVSTQNPLINQLLSAKGIADALVKYQSEDGEIEEVDFYSLPAEDQLAILNSTDSDINFGLDDNEITTVNFLRENGVTFDEAISYYKKQAIQEHIDSQNIAGIEVDQYSDEDLFAIDLKAKYDDFTDEEIKIELEKQLEHPELFKKKVDKLRTDYKQIEVEQLEAVRLQEEQLQEQKVIELRDNLISVAESTIDIGGLDLDNDDKNEVLSYILQKDINGISPFIKSLDSPKQLFELAWYATKGKQAFDLVHDYYKKEIAEVNKAAYAKGKADAIKKATPSKQTRQTYVRTPTSQSGRTPVAGQKVVPDAYPDLDDILTSHLND